MKIMFWVQLSSSFIWMSFYIWNPLGYRKRKYFIYKWKNSISRDKVTGHIWIHLQVLDIMNFLSFRNKKLIWIKVVYNIETHKICLSFINSNFLPSIVANPNYINLFFSKHLPSIFVKLYKSVLMQVSDLQIHYLPNSTIAMSTLSMQTQESKK